MLRVRDSSAAPPVSRLMTDWNSLLVIGCANGRLRGRQAKRRLCRTRQGLSRPCWRHLYVGIAQRPDHLEPAPLVHGFGHFGSRHPTETDRWLAKKCVGSTPTPHSSTVSCILGNSSLFSIVGGCPSLRNSQQHKSDSEMESLLLLFRILFFGLTLRNRLFEGERPAIVVFEDNAIPEIGKRTVRRLKCQQCFVRN